MDLLRSVQSQIEGSIEEMEKATIYRVSRRTTVSIGRMIRRSFDMLSFIYPSLVHVAILSSLTSLCVCACVDLRVYSIFHLKW